MAFDERQVPHIFAENLEDAAFVQGFLTAKDRLWQMDFISRAAVGRIAEVVGEKALEYDPHPAKERYAAGCRKMPLKGGAARRMS